MIGRIPYWRQGRLRLRDFIDIKSYVDAVENASKARG